MIRKLKPEERGPRSYICATCGRAVEYAGTLPNVYPFCTQRCQMVDLGKWLLEEYAIDRPLTPDDLPDSEELPG